MKALQWDGESLHLNELPRPKREAGEALLRVSRAGICNTDLEITRGYHSFSGTLGHEFVGVVEEADDASLLGRRVVSDINCACAACAMCRRGQPHHCLNRRTIGISRWDGAFSEYLRCPQANLVPLPGELSDENAVFAEPLAAALEILEQVDCREGEEVAVVGDGKLGLLIVMALACSGLRVHLIGHHRENFALVEDLGVSFHSRPPERSFRLVVEASGHPSGFHDALGMVEATGTLVLKSTYAAGFDFNPSLLVVKEIRLLGSRCGPMDKAVALLAGGRVRPERLIVAEYPLEQGVEAMARASQKGVLKVLLKPPSA